jgi:hypothetical protein
LGGNIVHKLIIAGLGVLAVALLAAGCGGGGTDEATAQVSKAEFYKQARAVCAKTQKTLQAKLKASGSLSHVYNEAAPVLKREAEELASISGPEQVEEEVEPMVANLTKASGVVAKQGEKAVNNPSIDTYKKEAAALHLDEC